MPFFMHLNGFTRQKQRKRFILIPLPTSKIFLYQRCIGFWRPLSRKRWFKKSPSPIKLQFCTNLAIMNTSITSSVYRVKRWLESRVVHLETTKKKSLRNIISKLITTSSIFMATALIAKNNSNKKSSADDFFSWDSLFDHRHRWRGWHHKEPFFHVFGWVH